MMDHFPGGGTMITVSRVQGGGWCYDNATCAKRLNNNGHGTGHLVSSTNWPDSMFPSGNWKVKAHRQNKYICYFFASTPNLRFLYLHFLMGLYILSFDPFGVDLHNGNFILQ
jgi:hypothetical protein